MTLNDAAKKFDLPLETLKKYISFGLIRENSNTDGTVQYKDSDFERLGLVDTLIRSGFTLEETKKYLLLTEDMGADEEQIRMLKKQRRSLLNDIHKKQQLLDNLDYMIWNKKNKA